MREIDYVEEEGSFQSMVKWLSPKAFPNIDSDEPKYYL